MFDEFSNDLAKQNSCPDPHDYFTLAGISTSSNHRVSETREIPQINLILSITDEQIFFFHILTHSLEKYISQRFFLSTVGELIIVHIKQWT